MNGQKRIWTIPNGLSFLRLLLIIPIILALHSRQPWLAIFLMCAGGVTDLLDGWLARKLDQQSDLGRIMDPVIDKVAILCVVCYMVFSPAYFYPLWFFLVQLGRELLIMIGGLFVMRRQKVVMESMMLGKVSALVNGVAVLLFVFDLKPFNWIVLYMALGLTLLSTVKYAMLFINKIKQSSDNANMEKQHIG